MVTTISFSATTRPICYCLLKSEEIQLQKFLNNYKPIPKIIHFIWLGELIPRKNIVRILRYVVLLGRNKGQVYVWTDRVSQTQRCFAEHTRESSLDKVIIIKDINEINEGIDRLAGVFAEEARILYTEIASDHTIPRDFFEFLGKYTERASSVGFGPAIGSASPITPGSPGFGPAIGSASPVTPGSPGFGPAIGSASPVTPGSPGFGPAIGSASPVTPGSPGFGPAIGSASPSARTPSIVSEPLRPLDELLKLFITLEYKNASEFSKYYKERQQKFSNFATCSDFFRLIILFLYGGIYNDCDNDLIEESFQVAQGRSHPSNMNFSNFLIETIYLSDLYCNSVFSSGRSNFRLPDTGGHGIYSNSLILAPQRSRGLIRILILMLFTFQQFLRTSSGSDGRYRTEYERKRYTQINPDEDFLRNPRGDMTISLGPGCLDSFEKKYGYKFDDNTNFPKSVYSFNFPNIKLFRSINFGVDHDWFAR